MRAGEIDQVGTPRQVYEEPATAYVADFLGIANLLPATVTGADTIEVHGARLEAATGSASGPCTIVLRPEQIRLVPTGEATLRARVDHVVFAGPVTHVHLTLGGQPIQAVATNDGTAMTPSVGDEVGLALGRAAIRVLAAGVS
jgi:ABC-type Fe3+/spermidine/putrescine transport system ATPase subunit